MAAIYESLMTPKVKQKKSQKCACLGLQMLSCISVLNRSLPSGAHLSSQRRRACYFNCPVVFFGQIIGYNWRLENYLMLFSDILNRTEANNKTSESWPCCLSGGHRQDTCPSCTPQRIRAAHESAHFISPLSDVQMPEKRILSQVKNHPKKDLFFQVFSPGEGRGKYYRSLSEASVTRSVINHPLATSPKWTDSICMFNNTNKAKRKKETVFKTPDISLEINSKQKVK